MPFSGSFSLGSAGICKNNTKVIGENNPDQSGSFVSSIGDLDGDGKPELIIGANQYATSKGATYVISGSTVSTNLNLGTNISLSSASTANSSIVRIVGENNFDGSGAYVSSIGDLNSDGKPELIIGAYNYLSNSYRGATYIVSGATVNANLNLGTNISLSSASTANSGIVRIVGENNNDISGVSVGSIGDLNGDGKSELIIGAYTYPNNNNQGATYVISGATVNSNLNAGTTISLSSASTANSGIVRVVGENNNGGSGYSISSIGDLNGDGKPELIIGAYAYPNNNNQGATYIVSGATVNANLNLGTNISLSSASTANSGIVRIVGENNGDASGVFVSSIGDLNGDGKPELIIGANGYSSGKGATYIVSGATVSNNLNTGTTISLSSASTANSGIVRVVGENNGDASGRSVNPIGDLDGDGKSELIIGASRYPNNNAQGATYIVSGSTVSNNLNTGTTIFLVNASTANSGIVRLVGENNNDISGFSVSSINDLDGDGKPELITGAYGYPNGNTKGATYIVSGINILNCASPSSSPSSSASPSSSVSPSPSKSPSSSPSASPSPSKSPSSSPSTSPSPSKSPSNSPSASPSPSKSPSNSPSASPSSPSDLPSSSPSASPSPSDSISPIVTGETTTISKTNKETSTTLEQTSTTAIKTIIDTSTKQHGGGGYKEPPQMFGVNGGHLHRGKNAPEQKQIYLQARDVTDDDSSDALVGLPLNAAQIPFAQTVIYLAQQGFNKIASLWQGGNKEEQNVSQKLLPIEQVTETLNNYINISNKLEGIVNNLDSGNAQDKALIDWFKYSLIEHKKESQKLISQEFISEEAFISYCQNMQVLTDDLSEQLENLNITGFNKLALTYIKAELANVNQTLSGLQLQLETAENADSNDQKQFTNVNVNDNYDSTTSNDFVSIAGVVNEATDSFVGSLLNAIGS